MDKKDFDELQKRDTWDIGNDAEAPRRPRKARAVVSVAFPSDDFARVERYAKKHDLTISELIRSATLSYVSGQRFVMMTGQVAVMSVGGPAEVRAYFDTLMPTTVAGSATFEAEQLKL